MLQAYHHIEDFIHDDSFLAYCAGKDEFTVAKWEQWLLEHPDKKEVFMQAKELVLFIQAELSDPAREAARFGDMLQQQRSRRFRLTWMMRAAAAVLLLAGAGWCWHLFSRVPYVEVASQKGQIREVALPDGSRMWLNGQTSVRYVKDFQQQRRIVLEEGEAFFEVSPGSQVPFEVHTPGGLQVLDIGTAFSLRCRRELGDVLLKVQHGKVVVKNEGASLGMLEKNQGISIDKKTLKTTRFATDALATSGWLKGTIVLENGTFEELAIALENKFKTKVSLQGGGLSKRPITIMIKQEEELDQILTTLTTIYQVTYQLDNGHITISERK